MSHEERIKSGFKGDLKELEIAWNHFEFCEPEFIDCAIDNLRNAEEALSGILMRARYVDTPISKNKKSR